MKLDEELRPTNYILGVFSMSTEREREDTHPNDGTNSEVCTDHEAVWMHSFACKKRSLIGIVSICVP